MKRWLAELMTLLAYHLGVTLPPLPSVFATTSTSRARIEEESEDDSMESSCDDDSKETKSNHPDFPTNVSSSPFMPVDDTT